MGNFACSFCTEPAHIAAGRAHVPDEKLDLVFQWLRLCGFTAKNPGSVPGGGIAILQTMWHSPKRNKNPAYLFAEVLGDSWMNASQIGYQS